MNKKSFWLLALAVTMIIGISGTAEAAETNNASAEPLQEAIENLENGYSEYYDISDCRTILCSSIEADGTIENTYMLTMNAVLKVSSVEEMDYYRGITAYYHSAINQASAAAINDEYSQMRANYLSSQLSDIYEDLNSYIGKKQELIFLIKETYSINDDSQKEILFENGPDYVSWEEMLPASHNELLSNGYATMANIDSNVISTLNNAPSSPYSVTFAYSINDAVNYMTTYTSNPASCNVCNGNCQYYVDTTKYNPNYSYHVYPNDHNDCANYVSQGLSAGGLPEDSTWKPGSSAWMSVSALTSYMISKGYWASIPYSSVKKGDILIFSEPHIVMITDYDGTTYKYSGHTNDRLNFTITINSSKKYTYYHVTRAIVI